MLKLPPRWHSVATATRLGALLALVLAPLHVAADATVAVATNFADTAHKLFAAFPQAEHGQLIQVAGSSGTLFAQIRQGAPFDVFLSADEIRPQALIDAGLAVAGSRFTYALGALVLWRPNATMLDAETLRRGDFRRIALANPQLAPYGAAAREVLQRLGLWQTLQPKIVLGENIGQAYALVASGNAELGFVAAAPPDRTTTGARWVVDASLYPPIRQDAVLLRRAADNATARAFLTWLRSDAARAIIAGDGYRLE
ncbi:MAG: molybdate ABC transporter substrate-binding protein [Gammaproteobacteria bacterium]|nr:molybdate ABC transporter substrate-binding protein [Gammaproteobacteria bacterium]